MSTKTKAPFPMAETVNHARAIVDDGQTERFARLDDQVPGMIKQLTRSRAADKRDLGVSLETSWLNWLAGVEDYEACPVCGEPIDYCAGHGEIGDPEGAALLRELDEEDDNVADPERTGPRRYRPWEPEQPEGPITKTKVYEGIKQARSGLSLADDRTYLGTGDEVVRALQLSLSALEDLLDQIRERGINGI